MRIGIVSNIDNGKGLQRDYELLAGLLRGWGHDVVGVHFKRDAAAPPCDLLVFLETLETRFFGAAPRRWFVPNPEWWEPGRAAELDGVERVLCKTRDAERIFRDIVGERAVFTGWIAEDRHDPGVPRRRAFLHTPGDSDMKGTAAVIEAWRRHRIEHPLVLVGPQAKRARRLPRTVEVHGRLDDAALRRLQNECAFHLCPSAYEGFGHTLHEALSVGAIVLTTAAGPMAEVRARAVNVFPSRTESLRSATLHHVDADAVAEAVRLALGLPDNIVAEVSSDARAEFLEGRDAFVGCLRGLVGEGTSEPAATLPARPRPRPRLAICFPAHASAAPLLRRSVLALRAQTADPDAFEVVIGADGGDPDGVLAAAAEPDAHPFRVRIVPSPRPRGEVPHRNHARNAAWRAAEAPLVWILDCDFTLPPEAVEHALIEHDAALARGLPAVLTTCMAGWGGVGPGDWLARSAAWAESGDPEAYRDLLATWPEQDPGIFNGFPDRYQPGAPASVPLPDLHEGMPIVPRGLLNVMGGFDEELGEWGDDKVELVDRLRGLAKVGLFELRLVTSVMALHQPHERDPAAHTPAAKKRQQKRNVRARLIETNAAWWRPQVEAARDALPGILAPLRPAAPAAAAPSAPVQVYRPAPAPKGGGRRGGREPMPTGNPHFLATEALALVQGKARARPLTVAVVGGGAVAWATMERPGLSLRQVAHAGEVEGDAVLVYDAFAGTDPAGLEQAARVVRGRLPKKAAIVVVERTGKFHVEGRPVTRPPIHYQSAFAGLSLVADYEVGGDRWSILAGRLL